MEIQSTEVDRDVTPFGVLRLLRFEASTGEDGYEIWIDDAFLMATHGSHSERAMARLGWERLEEPREGLHVLVGGLGVGHTLRAVLDLAGVERVVVAEISAKVVQWARTSLAPYNGEALTDPRVQVHQEDVASVLARTPAAWDLVLLDVDNGPGWLATGSNAALYGRHGVECTLAAVRGGGLVVVWSPARNTELEETLAAVSSRVEWVDTSAEGRSCAEPGSVLYVVWPNECDVGSARCRSVRPRRLGGG